METRLNGRIRRACAALAMLIGFGAPALAAPTTYSGVTFFGDSLSDTGNVLSLTTALSPPPFPNFPGAPGRFSNGPVWVEHVAAGLGFASAAAPSNLIFNGSAVVPIGAPGGQNFAFGGARTGLGGSAGATTGLLGQLVAWNGTPFAGTLTRAADPDALYVVVAGGNDMRDFRSNAPGALSPAAAAANLVHAMGLLAQAGARHFLVANLPDLGASPEAAALGVVAQSTAATVAFNAALGAGLDLLDAAVLGSQGVDLDIMELDMFALLQAVVADATGNGGGVFGITNISAPCMTPVAPGAYFFPGSSDAACGNALFSDALHPSAVAHYAIGYSALVAVGAIPEPASLALVALALLAVVAVTRRVRAIR